MAKRGTKRVLEYARLAMGFANVRAPRYGVRSCSGGYSNANAGAGAGPSASPSTGSTLAPTTKKTCVKQAYLRESWKIVKDIVETRCHFWETCDMHDGHFNARQSPLPSVFVIYKYIHGSTLTSCRVRERRVASGYGAGYA